MQSESHKPCFKDLNPAYQTRAYTPSTVTAKSAHSTNEQILSSQFSIPLKLSNLPTHASRIRLRHNTLTIITSIRSTPNNLTLKRRKPRPPPLVVLKLHSRAEHSYVDFILRFRSTT
jgi:hypothetical protein